VVISLRTGCGVDVCPPFFEPTTFLLPKAICRYPCRSFASSTLVAARVVDSFPIVLGIVKVITGQQKTMGLSDRGLVSLLVMSMIKRELSWYGASCWPWCLTPWVACFFVQAGEGPPMPIVLPLVNRRVTPDRRQWSG